MHLSGRFFFFLNGKQTISLLQTGAFMHCILVMGVVQTESELLRGAAGCRPRGGDTGRQHRPASQGLLEQCFCREVEREGLCEQECECARGSK